MGNAGYGNHTDDTKETVEADRTGPQGQAAQDKGGPPPAAGPHAKPSLTNPDATPGAGSLPDIGDRDGTDSTSG